MKPKYVNTVGDLKRYLLDSDIPDDIKLDAWIHFDGIKEGTSSLETRMIVTSEVYEEEAPEGIIGKITNSFTVIDYRGFEYKEELK